MIDIVNAMDPYALTGIISGLVLILMLVWQGFRTWQIKTTSRAEIASDEAYRKLAEESVSAQQKMAEEQQNIAKDLSEMKERIYAMEKMLREVD